MKFELKYFKKKKKKKKKVRDISMTHCYWDFKVQIDALKLNDLSFNACNHCYQLKLTYC